ncbi:Insulin-like growth factor binding protein, N-terminal [Pseudocohnilembus persalinus]|uniref:Insulin-like growth factor binding protein, N-terminal n=1 Tax=Pseudocohnilembus persalinus TaxID=266149 RepID=A0A0V0QR52_PSEPJ|nr:Insulin-like growth factor binding protein, N-terminal [Pseudocohnilembus persalinus]|eukprot:KRX04496.1 Insulin-like growth factor binding protein, N-terminal [Pseudocohnilembus persalinus]
MPPTIIDSVTNPVSTKPSSTFQFITYYDGTHIVDDSTTLTFTATGGSLTNPIVTPASTTVGNSNVSYSISFDSGSGLVAGGQIQIDFPSTVISSNTGSDSCSIVIGAAASQTVTCTVQDSVTPNIVTLTSVPAIAKGDTVVVTINNEFQNPYMVSTTYGTYKIYTMTSAGYAVDSVTSGIFSIIDTPIPFNSNSLAYSDETNANTSTFTFTFEISVPHTDGDFINDFDMDYVQDGTFSLDCNLPCRSCSGSDPDSCLTCYTSVAGISETLFVVSANECVSACPSGTVDNLMNQCITCTDPCATCGNNDPTHCLTCDNTYYLNASNQCVQECGDGFFEDDSLSPPYCTPCDGTTNFCQTCESLTECTSCVAPRLYYSPNNVCISDCETYTGNAMVNDPTNTNCVSCVSPCATCTGDVNTCLSCVSGYYYLAADQACYNPCPDGYGISGSDCLVCDPSYNCATCPNDITTCTSCPTGFYYKSDTNECLAACPAGYYVNGDNCTKCNKACATCTASKVCQTCNTDYDILFNDFCYTVCPSDYPHYIGGTCLSNDDACGENCAKCYTNDDLTCYECDTPFLLYGDGECVTSCPDGYEPNSEETQCVEESAYTENFESYRHIPIPITLLSIPFAFSVYISKKQYPITYLAGSLVSIICVFEYAAYMVLAFFYWQRINDEVSDGEIDSVSSSKTVLLLLISVISLYLWNLMAAINFCFFFSADKKFRQWKAQSYGHEISDNILRFFGFFLTFRLMRFYYSRYFDYTYFKMKLESVNKLLCLNFITVCSVIAVNIPMIFGAGSVIYFTDKVDQIFWQALDVLILSLLMIVLLIYENKKEKNFFKDKDEGLNQTLMGLNSKGFNDNNISQAYSQYPYGKNMHYLDVKDQDEENEEFKEDKKNTEENNAVQNPLSEHDIPGQGESVNQAQLAPHMQYQQQEETVVPGKPRQFSSNRLNPYKKYQVLNPIVEEEEYDDPKENKTKIFMDDNENIDEIKKEKKFNFSYSEESFYIGPNENEISFYDDNFEPDTPLRQNKIDHLTCIRPGYVEMSRGLGINNDNRGINNDDEDILELSNMSDMSDFDIQKPVKFNQVNGNNIQQSRKNLLNTMITDNDNDFDENYTISEFKPGQKNMRKYKKQNEEKQIKFDQKSQGSNGKKSNQDIYQNNDKNQNNDQNDDLIYIDIEQQYRIASNEQQKRNSSTSDFNQNNISLQELDSNTKLKSQNPILDEKKNNKKKSFILEKDKINNDQIIKESSQENSLFEDKKKQFRKSKNFGKKSKNFDLGTSSMNKENSSQVKKQKSQDQSQENSETQINQQLKENQNKEKPDNNQEKSVQSQKQINNDNINVNDVSASKNELEMGKNKPLSESKQEKLNNQKNIDNSQNNSESKKDQEKNKEQDDNDLDQQKQQEEQKQSQKLIKNENQQDKNVKIDNGNKNKQNEKQIADNKSINASNNLIGINNISHISEIPMSNENRLKENLKNKLKNKGEEELESLGDSQVLQNQISPSDFNYLNMRFDDNFLENDFIKVDQNNSNQKDENDQNYDNKSQNHRTQIQPSSIKFQSGLINKQKSVESQNLQDMIDFSDYDEYQNRKKDQNPQENLPNNQMLGPQENNLNNNQSEQSNFKKKKKAHKNNNKKGSGQFLNSQRSQRSVDKNKQNKDLISSKYTDDQFKQLGIKEMASHLQHEQIKKGVTKKINLNEDKRLKELEKIYMRNNKNQYSARSQQKNKNDIDLDFLQESD